jgi:hypothetical protein
MKEDTMRVRSSLRRRRAVGLALATCSLVIVIPAAASAQTDTTTQTDGSSAAVQPQDLRSPDTRDAALAAEPTPARTDLRSPDTRDAALAAEPAPARTDLRSPDTRDAALAAESGTPSTPPSPVAVQPTVVPIVDHGSQTLAIVFSSTALFLALAAVGFAALYRRPRPRWSAS